MLQRSQRLLPFQYLMETDTTRPRWVWFSDRVSSCGGNGDPHRQERRNCTNSLPDARPAAVRRCVREKKHDPPPWSQSGIRFLWLDRVFIAPSSVGDARTYLSSNANRIVYGETLITPPLPHLDDFPYASDEKKTQAKLICCGNYAKFSAAFRNGFE